MTRVWSAAVAASFLSVTVLPAQNATVRWNTLVDSLGLEQAGPPAVRVWLDQRIVRLGEPVRVGFRVDEEAYVVVGRVDGVGNLTVLFPTGRGRVTGVSAGEDHFIRSARLGTRATFVANERSGGSGFVFALSSREPLYLSRLSQRDFSSWVTGVSVGRPIQRYVGDPYRVIQRFARLVTYSPASEWDYDMEFYSVDQPTYASTAYSSGYCGGWNSSYGAARRYASWDAEYDDFGSSQYGYGQRYGCDTYRSLACYSSFTSSGYLVPVFCAGPLRRGTVASGPVTPAPPTSSDSTRLNGWTVDSITRPNVDKVGNPGGPDVMTVDRSRPNPVGTGWNNEQDLSFSIPSRALRGVGGRGNAIDRPAPGNGSSGPVPMPARSGPEVINQPIEWVRPPRSFEQPSRGDIDRLPSRSDLRRGRDELPDRPARDWSPPPPRTSSPMFDREPIRNSGYSSGARGDDMRNRGYNPPAHFDGPRPMSSPGMEQRPTSSPAASSGSGASASPPPAPASTGVKVVEPERKPPPEKQP